MQIERFVRHAVLLLVSTVAAAEEPSSAPGPPESSGGLYGAEVLEEGGDRASDLIEAWDRFLLEELARVSLSRANRPPVEVGAYAAEAARLRARLSFILGLRDRAEPTDELEFLESTRRPGLVARGPGYGVRRVRWRAFGRVHGEGLLLSPEAMPPAAWVVAIPDAGETPESLSGLAPGTPDAGAWARRLAEWGLEVLVPAVMDRGKTPRGLTRREFLYRSAYELGRHIQGYEIAKILAAVDILEARAAPTGGRVGLVGWGEGGLLALHASALDTRVSSALVSGYFGPREEMWREPLDRNVFDYLDEFGGAEVAALSAPRTLVLEAAEAPNCELPPGTGGGPGRISTASLESVLAEAARASAIVRAVHPGWSPRVVPSLDGSGPRGVDVALEAFLEGLGVPPRPERSRGEAPKRLVEDLGEGARAALEFEELDRHNQELLSESAEVRKAFLARLDTSSLERFESTVEEYRRYFREETIGCFERELAPPRPRARRIFDGPRWTGYEVILDVFPGVPVPGILVVPCGIGPGDRWPAVVCQHGLEGRPRDVADPTVENPAYGQFALRLAERGYVTFAPQNPYIFGDRFRSLQRKANPLGKTLFSLIVPTHEQIVRWLGSLPFVDPARIGFYGLSYGGKTAMRVPPLVRGYALSICSADFNDWIWKNASTASPYSYVWTGEYEIFEFDLGSTFNYSDMAALIAPRPFLVERGHFDGVAPDDRVASEFAKVRFLYAARLGIGGRAEIEWFVGPHAIHGRGSFDFLDRHLGPPGIGRERSAGDSAGKKP